jgi:hypothetical protein
MQQRPGNYTQKEKRSRGVGLPDGTLNRQVHSQESAMTKIPLRPLSDTWNLFQPLELDPLFQDGWALTGVYSRTACISTL